MGVGALGAVATGVVGDPYGRLTLHQELRLGAIDGVNFAWRSAVYTEPDGSDQQEGGGFLFGMGRGELTVPVSSRLSLYGGGQFGFPGYGYGELGVRSMFFGAGGPGTMILLASLGASIVGQSGGPAVSFGMEWRL